MAAPVRTRGVPAEGTGPSPPGRRYRYVAWVLWLLAVLVYLGAMVAGGLTGSMSSQGAVDVVLGMSSVLGAVAYATAGLLIVSRHPGQAVGWLLMAVPLSFGGANLVGGLATYGLATRPGSIPFARALAWIDRWSLLPILGLIVLLVLLFPEGRIPSRRWRPVLWLAVGAPLAAAAGFALTPGRMTGSLADLTSVVVANPLGIDALAAPIGALTVAASLGSVAAGLLAAGSMVVRYRSSKAEVRQQIRWMALVAAIFLVAFLLEYPVFFLSGGADQGLGSVLSNVLFAVMALAIILGIPAACAIAILKYRLYDLDVVVRKTLVVGSLAVFFTVVYAGIVAGLGAVVGSRFDSTASFLAAAAVAVVFAPARDRARRLADRLVYGRRATPYEILTEFSSHMASTEASTDVLSRMAEVLGTGTGARRARVWLRVGRELSPAAAWPSDAPAVPAATLAADGLPEVPDQAVFEVRHRGELLGAISVSMPESDPLTPAKEKLARDFAAQASLALRNVRLIEELRASRQRLVAAQDEERRRLERNIHGGAQQQLVALAVKLGLAEGLIDQDPVEAREMIQALRAASQEALEDLR
ncbi:MAG TPA: histidine kinase, partial [Actinomycetota bacterium]|nr:histidine kinase [Actinomycetota bacterium]